jgi:hypothetical protein
VSPGRKSPPEGSDVAGTEGHRARAQALLTDTYVLGRQCQ